MSVATVINHWSARDVISNSKLEDHSAEIAAGDFGLDVASRTASLHGKKLALSSAEFDLLRYLITHRKMLVTPHTVLSTACDALNVRRTEFMKNLLSLNTKLDDASGRDHYLHIEPWVLYELDLT